MARAILKTGNTILKTQGKIFQVGNMRPPIADFNPELISNVNDGDKIERFLDGSGNGNHGIQINEAKQPVIRLNVINGFPALESDGVNDNFTTLLSINAKTIFIVCKDISSPAFGSLFGSSNANFIGGGTSYFADGTEVGESFGSNPSNKIYVNGGLSPTVKQATRNPVFTLMTLDVTDTRLFNYIFSTGRAAGGLDFFKGQIARLIVFDYRMQTVDRKAKELELLTQYAL